VAGRYHWPEVQVTYGSKRRIRCGEEAKDTGRKRVICYKDFFDWRKLSSVRLNSIFSPRSESVERKKQCRAEQLKKNNRNDKNGTRTGETGFFVPRCVKEEKDMRPLQNYNDRTLYAFACRC
jgi:hypothetical protein